MKYQKQTTFAVGVVAVAALFFGIQAWNSHQLKAASWPEIDGGVYNEAVTVEGVTSLIPGNRMFESGVAKDGIPALTNPEFISVLASDAKLADDGWGIDVEVNGEHRFYPYQILNWHEVVNDEFNGVPLAVTYCVLCGTNGVYERAVDGSVLEFGITGKVYNNNTLLYDKATDSTWLQVNGMAVQGEMMGKSLTRYPSTVMTWADWKNAYPSGEVLSMNTGFARDYTTHPYGNYERQTALFFPLNHASSRLGPKWKTTVVDSGEATAVFVHDFMKTTGVQTYAMADGTNVVAFYDADQENIRVFTLSDERTFSYDLGRERISDDSGNVWSPTGVVTSGPERGVTLAEVEAFQGYWFCVAAMYPEEGIAGVPLADATQENEGETIHVDLTN